MMRLLCALSFWLFFSTVSVSAALGPDPTAPIGSNDFAETREPTSDINSNDSGPTLQEILIGPKRVLAVIDGKTLKVGDRFRNYKVIEIGTNQVTLQIEGVKEKLYLVDTRIVKR